MRVDLFDFELPRALIADRPAEPRDAARLLVVGERLEDRYVRDLPSLLRPGDRLVVNDTRVIRARLRGRTGAATVEVTLLRPLGDGVWSALARPAKRCRPGTPIRFAEDFTATLVDRGEGGAIRLRFDGDAAALPGLLERYGSVPLPPYIRRPDGPLPADADRYQTMFAREPGAVAAPTAGLHFTPPLLAGLAERGIALSAVTLHVGLGTFLPVTALDTTDHRMHAEWGRVGSDAAAEIRATRAAGGRVIAVGTTALRLLESSVGSGDVEPYEGECDLFITPGYRFRAIDGLMTNFHLPRSTLFMLVCALAGTERMQGAYAHAVSSGYRFYSYGDACLISKI